MNTDHETCCPIGEAEDPDPLSGIDAASRFDLLSLSFR